MKVFFVVALALVAGSQALKISDLEVKEQWEAFKTTHGKQYENETEELYRMKIFTDTLHMIMKHNERYQQGLESFRLAVTSLTDMLNYEVNEQMNGFDPSLTREVKGHLFVAPANFEAPDSIDWREQGAVTEVKNQLHCNTCWAFSAAGALEGQFFRKTGNLVSLSEKNLADCDSDYRQGLGCQFKGCPANAFRFVQSEGGIDTEDSYPYSEVDAPCQYNSANSVGTVADVTQIPSGDEQSLKDAVASVGPISVGIDASLHNFNQLGEDDVYSDPNCGAAGITHAVLVVGYGTTPAGQDYWLVKNSWGTGWGIGGYIKIARNQNMCLIATQASYPTVA